MISFCSYKINITFFLSLLIIKNSILIAQAPIINGPPIGNPLFIQIYPNNSNIIITADALKFTGFLKSEDGGLTWALLNQGVEYNLPSATSILSSFTIDPLFPDTMYAFVRTDSTMRFYRSIAGGVFWEEIFETTLSITSITAYDNNLYIYHNNQLYYSSDVGNHLNLINSSIPTISDICIDPYNSGNIYVGTREDGLFFSSDSGKNFERVGFPGNRIYDFEIFRNDSLFLLLTATGAANLQISANNGLTWYSTSYVSSKIQDFTISNDPDIIYAVTFEGVFKTLNRGVSWEPANNGIEIDNMFEYDDTPAVISVEVDPYNPNIVYAGRDYARGLFKSVNGGETWILIGIPSGHVSGLSVTDIDPSLVLCGTADGVFFKTNDDWKPTRLLGFPTGISSVLIYQKDSLSAIAAYGNGFGEPQIFKTNNLQSDWEYKYGLFEGDFLLDFVPDPQIIGRIYGVWWSNLGNHPSGFIVSNDYGESWQKTVFDTISIGIIYNPLAINPFNNNEMYILERSGIVYKSEDGAVSWRTVKEANDTSHYAIVVDPNNPSKLFVGSFGIWRSMNSGENWSLLEFNHWVHDLTFDKNSGILFAATFGEGLFYSSDDGTTWDSLPKPANPFLRNVEVISADNTIHIYSSSFGSGVFEWQLELNPIHVNKTYTGNKIEYSLYSFPNPFNNSVNITFSLPERSKVTIEIFNILGKYISRPVDKRWFGPGNHAIKWNVDTFNKRSMATGIYFILLRTNGHHLTKKIIYLK